MVKLLKNKLMILVFLSWSSLGSSLILLPNPTNPDVEFGRLQILGTLGFFCFWAISAVCWGALISKRFHIKPTFALASAIGTVAYATIAQTLLLITIAPSIQKLIVILLGLIAPLFFAREFRNSQFRFTKAHLAWIPLFLTASVIFFKACLLHFHSDALLYGALAPRLWSELGHIHFLPNYPYTFLASQWDYLGIYGNALMGGEGPHGLIEHYLFIQLTHAFFGFLITAMFSAMILEQLGLSPIASRLGAVAIGSCGTTVWTAHIGKSDWGVSAWTLGGMYLLMIMRPEKRCLYALCGFILGVALAAKQSFIFVQVPFIFWWTLTKRPKLWQAICPLLIGGSLAMFPFFARNYFYIGNPFFPALGHIFPSPGIADLVRETFLGVGSAQNGRPFDILPTRLKLLFEREQFALFGLLLLIGGLIFKKNLSVDLHTKFLWIAPGSFILLFCLLGAPVGSDDGVLMIRYLTPSLALLSCAGLPLTLRIIENTLAKALIVLGFVTIAFLTSVTPITDFPVIYQNTEGFTAALRSLYLGGDSKTWLRLNAQPSELILTTGDSQHYFVSHLNISAMIENPQVWAAIRRTSSPKEMIQALASFNPKYLLDTQHFSQRYWSTAALMLDQLVKEYPASILYRGKSSYVVDFEQLRKSCCL
jgi:hypothetical protein